MTTEDGTDVGITPALEDLIFFAAERALSAAGVANPFIPILTLENESAERTEVLLAESLDDPGPTPELAAIAAAKDVLRQSSQGITRYVIATDQFLTVDAGRFDAAVLEAGERGMHTGAVLAQRYKRRWLRRTVTPVGAPAYVGPAENLLS